MLVILKLVCGEDIMAECKYQDSEIGYYVEHPVSFSYAPSSGIIMKQWTSLSLDPYTLIPNMHVIADLGEPNELGYYYYDVYMKQMERANMDAIINLHNSLDPISIAEDDLKNLASAKKKLH